MYASNVNEERFISILEPLLQRFAEQRRENEHFGDYLCRKQLLDTVPVTPQ